MRYISFRFDDGFIDGASKAAALLYPDRASFFVIAERVLGTADLSGVPAFRGCDFGSVIRWQEMSAQGHDVQLHGWSHRDMSRLSPDECLDEVRRSRDLVRSIHDGPLVFCYPFNALADIDLAAEGLVGGGFATCSSVQPVLFNDIDGTADLYRLNSWAVRESHFDRVIDQLDCIVPDDSWTILAFHSLDGEGWEPWTSAGFSRLVEAVRLLDYQIVTIIEMVEGLNKRRVEALQA